MQIAIKKIYFFFFALYKNERKEPKFWKQKIKRSDFYKNKKILKIDGIDANKILATKKESYCTKNSFRYFTGYNDNDVIYKASTNDWL